MTEQFCDVLYLFASFCHGKEPLKIHSDAAKIMKSAAENEVVCGVFVSMKQIYKSNPEIMNEKTYGLYNHMLKNTIYRSKEIFLHIVKTMELLSDNGIEARLIKGRALANQYSIPECRTSCDTDLLISENDEKKAYKLLEENGFEVTPRTLYSNHATCISSKTGAIELHTSLFSDIVKNTVLDGISIEDYFSNSPTEIIIQNHRCKTLEITDHLIFTFLHLVYHFIRKGTSVRQITDVLLYIKNYKNIIKFDKFDDIVNKLGYRNLLNVLYQIGEKYLLFDESDFPEYEKQPDDTVTAFLCDLEAGGMLGRHREDDETVFRYYGAAKSSVAGEYRKYLKRYQSKRIINAVFPNRKRLISRYRWGNNIFLRPIAWVCWLIYGIRLSMSGHLSSSLKDEKNMKESDIARIEIFKKLNMINMENNNEF